MAERKKKVARPIPGDEEASAFFEREYGPLTFGGMLRAVRLGEGQSQQAFAEALGVSKSHLSDVELGRRLVSAERASKWALKLGYHQGQFVALALQAELDAAGIKLRVKLEAA